MVSKAPPLRQNSNRPDQRTSKNQTDQLIGPQQFAQPSSNFLLLGPQYSHPTNPVPASPLYLDRKVFNPLCVMFAFVTGTILYL